MLPLKIAKVKPHMRLESLGFTVQSASR
jgi:hypothetical protein